MRRAVSLVVSLLVPLGGCSMAMSRANGGIPLFEGAASPIREAAIGAKYAGWVLGVPLTVLTAPLAALAWATPWVDLPLAVDIASAPALGLGYLTEAAVGAPLYVACFGWLHPRQPAAAEPRRAPDDQFVPWGMVVEHHPAGPPRPRVALPGEVAARYALPPAAGPRLFRALAIAEARGEEPLRARLDPFPGALELYRAPRARAPLVLMTPPSQATFAARYLARRFARRGVHAAVIAPDGVFLDPALDAAGVEARLRQAVVAARAAVAALLSRDEVERVVFLGVSAGGVFGTLLLAVEPRVERAALILPGGDLAGLVVTSSESTVSAYREARAARGVSVDELRRSFARELQSEPLALAPYVDPGRVLLFLGASDAKVPVAGGLRLRRALGRPETYLLAGNHETAALCFGFVLREAEAFLLGTR